MRRRKPTLPSGTSQQSGASERGWTLAETLDGYAVEELTPTQAARLLRKREDGRLEPEASERALGPSLRNQAQGRQPHRLGRSAAPTGGSQQKDGEGGASDKKEDGVRARRHVTPVSQLGASVRRVGRRH
jgi:hypothetical protein